MVVRDRNGQYIKSNSNSTGTKILYTFLMGRILLSVLTRPSISKVGAKYMDSPLSKVWNKQFIKKNNIDLNNYEKEKYSSYNDLFTRREKEGIRVIDEDPNILISPCDSKLLVYPINTDSTFNIKDSIYSTSDLVGGKKVKKYRNGFALIFRLEVGDYHHYCYVDDGTKEENIYIKGILHTVQPVSAKYKVYKKNAREYTILHTNNFDDIIQIEVGAMMVGRIVNLHQKYEFKKGEEKGYFEFGGSTIVLLIKNGVVRIDNDILENSMQGIETIVKMGERIGTKRIK